MHDLRGNEYTFPETLYVLPKYLKWLRWLKRFIINRNFKKVNSHNHNGKSMICLGKLKKYKYKNVKLKIFLPFWYC